MRKGLFLLLILSLSACQNVSQNSSEDFDWQGHRGARGESPENTLEGFTIALADGVTTLEMDVVLTRDTVPLLSHEPYLNPLICLDSTGQRLPDTARPNIYKMTVAQVQRYNCGSRRHPDFPGQSPVKAVKPTLLEAILHGEQAALQLNRPDPRYNVEIKSRPAWDGRYYPSVALYVDAVVEAIRATKIGKRAILQSFDPRALRYAHRTYPQLKLALLAAQDDPPLAQQLKTLGFKPEVYSPESSRLTSARQVKELRSQGFEVIPWTVNQISRAKELKDWGVDGLITDYPQRLISALGAAQATGP
jgi:glycerophosphoryl diester phosphodiesterase